MTISNEPRALTAALQSPAFVTQGGGRAMHLANRHVERYAPEADAAKSRPLRNLGFVDRLVSPWIESAQRSASLRMFSQYISTGVAERPSSQVSWLFPRPWYQDELDWMAAARHVGTQAAVEPVSAPNLLTTRGTYVAPQTTRTTLALPSQLHEYVAPSLSIARPEVAAVDAYSPLVPLAATHAAHVMSSAVAPLVGPQATRMSPGLRAVLSTMLERTTKVSSSELPTRSASLAPELVTPPAPRPERPVASEAIESDPSTFVAERYAEQRAQLAELQRVARAAAVREEAARAAQRAPEVRAERQAEIQQRAAEIAARREADVRTRAEQTTAEAEKARIDARIAQRIAERTRQQQEIQRLHETAREAAARDARVSPVPAPVATPVPAEAPAAQPERRIGAEIAAAVAALPPELATMVASSISQRPERASQAIAELGEALRAIELLARNTAAGGSIEPTRGPRLVMPTGLGGLVSTVSQTTSPVVGERAAMRMPAAFAPVAPQAAPQAAFAPQATPFVASQAVREARMPAMTWLAQPGRAPVASMPAPTTALGAAIEAAPASLGHVAWSDRWLARFAGARPQSLDVLSAGAGAPETRMQMLAASAPSVFVAPVAESPAERIPAPRSEEVVRFDDSAETPDDVLFAIAAGAARTRKAAAVASQQPQAPAAPTYDPAIAAGRETFADMVAHSVPAAPGAGLSAQLASSPFAPALRHVLPLGVAPTFDVRALFGSGLGATFLAGLIASPTSEIATAAPAMPTWATWPMTSAIPETASRDIAAFEPTYVAPEAQRVEMTSEAEAASFADQSASLAAQAAPLTTLRSALLAFDVESIAAAPSVASTAQVDTRAASPVRTEVSLARSIVESLAMPMLAETASMREPGAVDVAGGTVHGASYASPGMLADRAHAWSVAQERSIADLSFDFVTPELVLAARVYGLGPAEAAQAARLAIAGPGQLTAMAGAVDRTFVQAMAIESERRTGGRVATAYPMTGERRAVAGVEDDVATTVPGAAPTVAPAAFAPTAAPSTFGVERRAPRGAFLWPQATTAALGMNAAAPDGEQSMSVAALELLAAQAVAELGTFAALGSIDMGDRSALESVAARAGEGASAPASSAPTSPATASELRDEDVLATAASFVPTARREKFQALYLALSQSPMGRSASPAARAARAVALAGRGDETITARERASVAWDVLPMVYGQPGAVEQDGEAVLSTGDAAARIARRREEMRTLDPMYIEGRPGLGALSARAGEALGSYVAPSIASPTASASPGSTITREVGAVMRAPTAAQELVQTGRPAGRYGGGEVEIPSWFEQAARKMLSEQSSVAGDISLAELTLVAAAPPAQIAASTRGAGGNVVTNSAPSATASDAKEQVDIEKVANDVYREVLLMMDIARSRNGEPYL
ncbi:MAG: hypothetical protein HOV81_32040 [Kofleriaceae bacterium]|nr:hypothetical protein [Kofleriaceae bacterium]